MWLKRHFATSEKNRNKNRISRKQTKNKERGEKIERKKIKKKKKKKKNNMIRGVRTAVVWPGSDAEETKKVEKVVTFRGV